MVLMNLAANRTPSRHPGEGRDTRQTAVTPLPLKELEFAADTEFAATLSIVPACAGMTAVGGQAAVAQGERA